MAAVLSCGPPLQVYMVKENEKLNLMERELNNINEKRVIVFVNTKKSCDIVSKHLEHLEYHCTVLHGGKTQVHFFPTTMRPSSSCISRSLRG